MSALVILNPQARLAQKDLVAIRGALADSAALPGADIQRSDDREHARRLAEEAALEGRHCVVAAGGDGTVNAVVNGLMAAPPPRPVVGVLPLGTGNDLARSLGIPLDVSGALETMNRAVVRRIDLIRIESESVGVYCANVSVGGFSGPVDENLTDEIKGSWGPLAYLRSAVEHITELESYHTVLRSGDGISERYSALSVVVANGRYVAGGVPVAPRARLDDGMMDVVVFSGGARLPRLGMLAARMAAGRHLDHELVSSFRTRSLSVESEPRMSFNADGELLSDEPPNFRVVPDALSVLVGEDRPWAL